MHKYATILAFAVLTSGYVAVRATCDIEDETAANEPAPASSEQVQEMVRSYRLFKITFQGTVESLRRHEIALRDAQARVAEASREYNPKYLRWLSIAEKGGTLTERVARNLIGHVRSLEKEHPTRPSPLPELEQELSEFIAEAHE